MLTQEAARLLSLRGIDLEAAVRYRISSVVTDKDGDWIEIPYLYGTEVTNLKRRTLSGNLRVSYDARPRARFWNGDVLHDRTVDHEPIIICQDELDAIALLQCGFARVVSIPDLPDSQPKADRFDFLKDSLKMLGSDELILAVHADEHGQRLMNDLAIRVGKARCKWLTYPMSNSGETRLQDIGAVLMEHGKAGVSDCLKAARWVISDGVYMMSELPPLPEPPVYRLGFNGLDQHYGVRRGDFCVVTGIPSHGKSSLLNDIACRMVAKHK